MRITAARLHAYRLPLRAAWASAAGGFAQRAGWLLRLETDAGLIGYGDCAPLPAIGTEPAEAARAALDAWGQGLPGQDVHAVLAVLEGFATPAARCALECALLDVLAQAEGVPLFRRLGGTHLSFPRRRESSDFGKTLDPRFRGDDGEPNAADELSSIPVNAALGALVRVSEQGVADAVAAGFSTLKLKLGVGGVEEESARLHDLAARLPPAVRLRLDANRAWDAGSAARFLAGCADLPVEALEEPLAVPEPAALRRLQAGCHFPLALDESWPAFDPATLFADPPVRRLVLKPPRLGGLRPALTVALRAGRAGMQCVVTSSIETACGVLAAAHLAAALDNGLAHGLATSAWLAADTGAPPEVCEGRLVLPGRPGLGFVPHAGLDFS